MPSADNLEPAGLPEEIEIPTITPHLPAGMKEMVTAAQVAELYASDDILANMAEEYRLAQLEYDESLPNVRELHTLYERARRHRSMLRFRCTTQMRRIRGRKKLLLQRVMDKKLTEIRKQLGLNKPRRIKLDLL